MAIVPVISSTAVKYKFIENKTKLDGLHKEADPLNWQRSCLGGSAKTCLSRKVEVLVCLPIERYQDVKCRNADD